MVKHELNGNGGFGKAKAAPRTFKATSRPCVLTPLSPLYFTTTYFFIAASQNETLSRGARHAPRTASLFLLYPPYT
jgi:hypothetical protein